MENLISAWDNYYFKNEANNKFYKVSKCFCLWNVFENVEDDINIFRFDGTLEECVAYCEKQGCFNYDPLAKFR